MFSTILSAALVAALVAAFVTLIALPYVRRRFPDPRLDALEAKQHWVDDALQMRPRLGALPVSDRLRALQDRSDALARRVTELENHRENQSAINVIVSEWRAAIWQDFVAERKRIDALVADMDQVYEAETQKARMQSGIDTVSVVRPSQHRATLKATGTTFKATGEPLIPPAPSFIGSLHGLPWHEAATRMCTGGYFDARRDSWLPGHWIKPVTDSGTEWCWSENTELPSLRGETAELSLADFLAADWIVQKVSNGHQP